MRAFCCTTDVVTRPLRIVKTVIYPAERQRLLELMRADQELRISGKLFDNALKVQQAVREAEERRTEEMLAILNKIKLPRATYVGLDGSRAIWLIALHNPSYKNAGQVVLDKMRYLFYRQKKDVFYPGIPYLVDRLRIVNNNFSHQTMQYYGTQLWRSVDNVSKETVGAFPISNSSGLAERLTKFDLELNKRNCRHVNG